MNKLSRLNQGFGFRKRSVSEVADKKSNENLIKEELKTEDVKKHKTFSSTNIIGIEENNSSLKLLKDNDLDTKEEDLTNNKADKIKKPRQAFRCEYSYKTRISLPDELRSILRSSGKTFSSILKPTLDKFITSKKEDKLEKIKKSYEKSLHLYGGKKYKNRVDLSVYSKDLDYQKILKELSETTNFSITEICIALFYDSIK